MSKTQKIKITLSLWDIGGQKRFDFFKTDFFKGTAAVGLVFDLTRPDTFEVINTYFKEIRQHAGNIPILLVGNKNDLKKEIGESIERSRIIKKANRFNLLEYVETSALEDMNVEDLFYKLSIAALLDLRPRLGEIQQSEGNSSHFRFKIILAGPAAVGKSSLIQRFTHLDFNQDYKLTVGLDLMTREIELEEKDLPPEALSIIKHALLKYSKKTNPPPLKANQEETKMEKEIPFNISLESLETIKNHDERDQQEKSRFASKKIYLILLLILIAFLIVVSLLIFLK